MKPSEFSTAESRFPFLFALLAGALGLRIRRGGRSVGVLLTLIVVIIYYLLSLLGESLARVGTVSPYIGPWLATLFIVGFSLVLFFINRTPFSFTASLLKKRVKTGEEAVTAERRSRIGVATLRFPNLMDATLLRTLALRFLVCFVALA